MFFRIGHPVQKLRRVAIGPLRDARLPVGALRELTEQEVESSCGPSASPKPGPRARRRWPGRPAGRKAAPGAQEAAGGREEGRRQEARSQEGGPMTASQPLIVAIDGPSGVGKSTAARRLARRLGVPFLDTGAMYRAIGLKVLESGVDPHDREDVVAIAGGGRRAAGPPGRRQLRGPARRRAGRGTIRTPEVGEATSAISAYPEVRQRMVRLQREAAGQFGAVLEGRDIGTRVFPETPTSSSSRPAPTSASGAASTS